MSVEVEVAFLCRVCGCRGGDREVVCGGWDLCEPCFELMAMNAVLRDDAGGLEDFASERNWWLEQIADRGGDPHRALARCDNLRP